MSARTSNRVGQDAITEKGMFAAYKWLVLRRISQLGILALFMLSPWFAVWLNQSKALPALDQVDPLLAGSTGNLFSHFGTEGAAPAASDLFYVIKGNLASSLLLDFIPLTDPYLFLQMLAAGYLPALGATVFTGVLILTVFYLLIGGRVFCSWVCPVNMVTDAASWSRRRLNIKSNHPPHANTRYWFLAGTLVAAALTGTMAMEWVNPVSVAHRGLFFGMGAGLWFIVALFLYDLLVASRGWCGHLCPMGALYSLLNKTALLRVAAPKRDACNDCMDCFAICPEPQVIRPALKKAGQDSPIILDSRCTTCCRCIDICSKQVFRLTHRFDQRSSS